MKIDISYPEKFDRLWERLQEKYPQEIFDRDGVGKQLDINHFSKEYFTNKGATADVSVDSNANITDRSVISYTNEMIKPYERLNSYFMLWDKARRLFGTETANEMIEAQLSGDIYINDFHGLGAGKPYCFNYSCYDIATKGLSMVNKIKCYPPKYLYAFKSQVEQFVTIASNSTLGATGLADLLLVMSFYVEDVLEKMGDDHFKFATIEDCWAYIKSNITSMIYTLNQPMRGNQSPFTNVSIYDGDFLETMVEDYIHPRKGTSMNIEIVEKLQDLYIDIINEELERTPITFPVTTTCHSTDKENQIKDEEFLDKIADKSVKYGFLNWYLGKSSTLSSCCRLRSEKISDYFNSFGAGSSKIGSLGVCTVNYPRLAVRAKGREGYFMMELEHLSKLAFKVNLCKRKIIEERIRTGFHPLYSEGFVDIDKQYLTHGVNGFNEAVELMGFDPLDEIGVEFGLRVIKKANEVNDMLGEEYNVPVNIEQIPAENSSIKLADKDSILGYNVNNYPLYSNQFIPLITKADMLDRVRLQGIYDEHFSGGAICHLNVEERVDSKEVIKDLIRLSAKMGVVYEAINYNLQRCKNHHITVGKRDTCPLCKEEIVDNYTRVVGFLTNTSDWHKVRRKRDYPKRQFYKGD